MMKEHYLEVQGLQILSFEASRLQSPSLGLLEEVKCTTKAEGSLVVFPLRTLDRTHTPHNVPLIRDRISISDIGSSWRGGGGDTHDLTSTRLTTHDYGWIG